MAQGIAHFWARSQRGLDFSFGIWAGQNRCACDLARTRRRTSLRRFAVQIGARQTIHATPTTAGKKTVRAPSIKYSSIRSLRPQMRVEPHNDRLSLKVAALWR